MCPMSVLNSMTVVDITVQNGHRLYQKAPGFSFFFFFFGYDDIGGNKFSRAKIQDKISLDDISTGFQLLDGYIK